MQQIDNTLPLKATQMISRIDEFEFEPIKGYPMLHWQGKRPFRATQFYPAQLKESYGEDVDGWYNKLFWGDNLQVMSHLLKEYRGQVDLIYIDPPFDSKADYKKIIEMRGKKISNDMSSFEEKQYTDIWTNDEYLQFMYERLILLRELLSSTGSIFVHCDWHKVHLLRCLMDEVFGANNFKNEIVWHYYNKMQGNVGRYASNHDIILFYSKSDQITFNKVVEKRDEPIKQIKRVWDKETQSLKNAKDENGNVIYIESNYKTVDDVWRLSMLQPADKTEPLGYPTQKPETLISRIIEGSSNPGDLVFDCFMGSGTTQAVAMKLGRRFIGADINLGAIDISTKRLLKIKQNLQSADHRLFEKETAIAKYYTGFEVYNVNNYDIFRNPVEAKEIISKALELQRLPGNTVYDGEKDGRMVKIMPVNRIATKADLNELITNFPYAIFDKRNEENPGKPVESIDIVCMGHEPDLGGCLELEMKKAGYKIDVEVIDILRDKSKIEFKRDAEADIVIEGSNLVVRDFYPMNLLQKLSLEQSSVEDWRVLVDSIKIDFNYDDAIFTPSLIDVPSSKDELVKGIYSIPSTASKIRIKITDLLNESYEEIVN